MGNKTALVTGVTGFIGTHLAELLVSQGWQVHCLLRKQAAVANIPSRLKNKLTLYWLEPDNGNLDQIIKQVKPTVVFHLASLFMAQHQSRDIPQLIASNITFGTQLVEAMVDNSVYSLVNTGTSWQHYQNGAYNPVCLYAATKEAFHSILKFYTESTPLKIITLKLFDTYGADDFRPKLFASLQRIAATGEALDMSPGGQYIDMVHIDDVTKAFLLAASYLEEGRVEYIGEYAVSSGQSCTLREFVRLYEEALGRTLNINWGKRPYREREVMIPWDIGQVLPGWQPEISLAVGMRAIVQADIL